MLGLERLEQRKLLAADLLGAPAANAGTDDLALSTAVENASEVASSARSLGNSTSGQQTLDLPSDLPTTFSVTVVVDGQSLTLELEKHSVYGGNTRFLLDDGSGELVEFAKGKDRSYIGGVAENSSYEVYAWLDGSRLTATITRPGRSDALITPVDGSDRLHAVEFIDPVAAVPHDHDGDGIPDHAPEDHSLDQTHHAGHSNGCCCPNCVAAVGAPITAASEGPIETTNVDSAASDIAASSTATLAPSRVMGVYEFEVGVEIGSAAFLNNYSGSTTEQRVANVMAEVGKIPANMDRRYLHATGAKHRLGTIIIRQSSAEDPFTVSHGNHSGGLSAFRNYWNANPGEVGSTHDLAVYHVRGAPSGLAYVNTVGTGSRYALSASNGPSSWADGTLVHEFGHSWSLGHVPSTRSPSFYEYRPRSNGAASGGSGNFISIMHGSGTHNIGRMSSGEANQVFGVLQGKQGHGDLIANPGNIKPFGNVDIVTTNGGATTIDVVANDFDANNDVLDARLRDTVSYRGGTISLSKGTGPGGRNELIYTPPAGFNGDDFFHYNVIDTAGAQEWGAVHITVNAPTTINLNQSAYFYDVGTATSPLFVHPSDDYQRLSDQTFGDLGFESSGPNDVESRDRGSISGVNNMNRDHIRLRSPSTFSHKLASGVYQIMLTVGDATENTDSMDLTAEAAVTLRTQGHSPQTFTNYTLNDVTVTDGELNLDIATRGFSANITRIIIRKTGEAPLYLNQDQNRFDFDLGTTESPVHPGWTRIHDEIEGDVWWSGDVDAAYHPEVNNNNVNRDYITSTQTRTLNLRVPNGYYTVTTNLGGGIALRDNMVLRAQDVVLDSDVDAPAGSFPYASGTDLLVNDGLMQLEISDTGDDAEATPGWAWTRLTLIRTRDLPAVLDPAQTQLNFDIGTFESPVQPGWIGITPRTHGDVWWTGGVDSGYHPEVNNNDINRDYATSTQTRTLNLNVPNGYYNITTNLGGGITLRDNMSLRAEGVVLATDVDAAAGSFPYASGSNIAVIDGVLNLEISDSGDDTDATPGWAWTRLSITRTDDIGFDYGDAPNTFATLLSQDGARHADRGPQLGDSRDTEPDGQPTTDASGDGTDEDGVLFGEIIAGSAMAGVNLDLQGTSTGFADAWIDFDGDGVFQADEKILDAVALTAGLQTLNYNLPASLDPADVIARVRVSSTGGLGPSGLAADGEVEDYRISISNPEVVESVLINDGLGQRSTVSRLTVHFDQEVTAPASAYSVTNRGTGETVASLDVQSSVVDGRTVSVIEFNPGVGVHEFPNAPNSLYDGEYELVIDSSQVQLAGGGAAMTNDYRFGDEAADTFFRKYGDITGDRSVNLFDFAAFRAAYGTSSGNPNFDAGFDSNGNGAIDLFDFAQFRSRFGT